MGGKWEWKCMKNSLEASTLTTTKSGYSRTLYLNDHILTMKPVTNQSPISSFCIVWKYEVKPECKKEFETEYGPGGSWNTLFGKSSFYIDSFLYKDDSNPDVFLLIDSWENKDSYQRFLKEFGKAYRELSAKFTRLYISEEKIGEFKPV